MLEILIYIILAYGVTDLLVSGTGPYNVLGLLRFVLGKINKEFTKMLDCMKCTGTNVGIILSIIDILFKSFKLTPFNILLPEDVWYLIIPLDAAFTAGIVWLIHNAELLIETHIKYDDDEE